MERRLSHIDEGDGNETCFSRERGIDFAGVCSLFIWQLCRIGKGGDWFAAEPVCSAKRGRLFVRGDGMAALGCRYLPGQQSSRAGRGRVSTEQSCRGTADEVADR